MDAERLRRRQLEMDLRNALKNDQLVLHYQPIVNAESGEIASCEALVRWIHPERGLIPPLQFVPLAEEMGLITKIGEWVLNQACRDATLMPKAMKMAVNVSVQQIKNPSFPLQVVAALNNSGLAPSRLELELTETIMASGDEVVLQSIKQLRDIGVRIALDDFGVGFSSLSCLKDFEFDRIKIDRSFLQNIERSKEAAIFHAIANMGIELGVATTAEGVETAEQLETVMAQGCTEVQGYFFSKPKPIHEVTAFVEAHKVRPKSKMEKKA
jgi:EAL domain-containing protein (putative c-di-GMP-specific phosphodiesterase class I)